MTWMNEHEIDEALEILRQRAPELAPFAQYLSDYRDSVNAVSDGWSSWRRGAKPAARLSELVQQAVSKARGFSMTDYPAAAEFKKATTPIKSFVAKLGDPKLTAPELVGAKTAEVAAPAPSARRGAGIQDFFVSDAVGSFVNDFCDGEQPWSVVVDPQDRLVVGSPSGGPCYRVSPSGDGFAVRLYDGPYVLIEDAGEALGSSIGAYPTVGDAFDAVVEHAGLDDANSPSP